MALPNMKSAPGPVARLLILACSAKKRPDPGAMPAIERYSGPLWTSLRKMLPGLQPADRPRILVLSAKYGFIAADQPIPDYNLAMDASRAIAIAADELQRNRLSALVRGAGEIHIAGGTLYRQCGLEAFAGLRIGGEQFPNITHTPPGLSIGYQRQALRRWLLRQPAAL